MCFVDTGNLEILRNLQDHRQIVLGRTGSGKSALLVMLGEDRPGQVIKISPEELALPHVSNSNMLTFFENIGVNLDPFFKLLWRHIIVVEILKDHFSNQKNGSKHSISEILLGKFPGNSRKDHDRRDAIHYLEKWGGRFWEKTEYRVKEITRRMETDLDETLKGNLGITLSQIGGQTHTQQKLTEEVKVELRTLAQDVVSNAQVEGLKKILDLVDSVLENKQKAYYVVIDGLDENWVEERLRYRLIMALIINTLDFTKVKNAKLIIALRRDLIERVFKMMRDSGFQEEKYQSSYLQLKWNNKQILQVLDRRVNQLVKRSYTRESVTHRDLFPAKHTKQDIGKFIFEIAPQPRDVIAFFNTVLTTAANATNVSKTDLKNIEGEYSQTRLHALRDEWSGDYPTLLEFSRILRGRSPSFKIGTIQQASISDLCLKVALENSTRREDALLNNAMQVVDCVLAIPPFTEILIKTFYRVGLIGLKLQPHEPVSYLEDGRSLSDSAITSDTSIVVSPPYRRALGITESQ